MAKRKRTKSSYYRDEYNRYKSALEAIGIKKPSPKKIQKREVERIRARWKKERKLYEKKTGFKAPTMKQAAKTRNQDKKQGKRTNLILEPVTQPIVNPPATPWNMYAEIVDNILQEIDELNIWASENGETSFYRKGTRQYNELQQRIAEVKTKIIASVRRYGKEEVGMILDSDAASGAWENVIAAKQGYAEMALDDYIATLTFLIERALT